MYKKHVIICKLIKKGEKIIPTKNKLKKKKGFERRCLNPSVLDLKHLLKSHQID